MLILDCNIKLKKLKGLFIIVIFILKYSKIFLFKNYNVIHLFNFAFEKITNPLIFTLQEH
jgi:hypothetical protein